MNVFSDDSFELIRENLYRGNRGKDGNQPLTWIALADIDDEYLDNLIQYCQDFSQTETIDYNYYLKEKEYRAERKETKTKP